MRNCDNERRCRGKAPRPRDGVPLQTVTTQMTKITIGTRGSPLARAQAELVRAALVNSNGLDPDAVALEIIATAGDRIQDRALVEIGGKGLFTAEIEARLLDGSIDMAVHSMKDMPAVLPDGLEICCILEREDVRDAFIGATVARFEDLPQGACVGTASLRRGAQARAARPDLEIVTFRGNVQTRLKKLEAGLVEGTFLAFAGLKRLGMEAVAGEVLATTAMLPAVAQGAIGIEVRRGNEEMISVLGALNHDDTARCVGAERAFLGELDGSCRTPIAGYARVSDAGRFVFDGLIIKPDGSASHATRCEGPLREAPGLCAEAGRELKARAGPGFLQGP